MKDYCTVKLISAGIMMVASIIWVKFAKSKVKEYGKGIMTIPCLVTGFSVGAIVGIIIQIFFA